MWVTVLASHPSVNIETETTQRIFSPSFPGFPTVFKTSRSNSSWVIFSESLPGYLSRYSALNSSISCAAIFLNSALIASPDSSCSLSTRIVLDLAVQFSFWTLLNSGSLPGAKTGLSSEYFLPVSQPEI